MSLIVMKFGGTSVAELDKIERAADKAVSAAKKGRKVVIVVSAPADLTDDLISLARGVSGDPDERELDMLLATGEQVSISLLAMAVKDKGYDAVSLTGAQAGIETDDKYTNARITAVKPARIIEEFKRGKIVIVAGFQGINPRSDVTTLGRGGSDLTAVALASALKADSCEIYTDVKGIYTADPRIVPQARKIERISYEEMLELAGAGSQVMQARSVKVAMKSGVPLHVRSSFYPETGTWICAKEKKMEDASVSSLALDKAIVQFSINGVEASTLMAGLLKAGIAPDMLVQSKWEADGTDRIFFTVPKARHAKTAETIKSLWPKKSCGTDTNVAKISIVGTGFMSHPWVAARIFETLSSQNMEILALITSDIRISCLVALPNGDKALRSLHKAFRLDKPSPRGY